jgi:K+-sensing histidine kinase KdpD
VEIIDSGCGIEKEQKKYLAVPFSELRVKKDIQKVKNNSIGMGLACTKVIMNQLKGSLQLKESIRGKIVFKIEMPVEKRDHRIEELSVQSSVGENHGHMVLSNYTRPL